jgi:hypothetical protein
MWKRIVFWLLRPKWVVFRTQDDTSDELGLKVWGVVFGLYKGDVLPYRDTLTTMRKPAKREFGESLHPQH